MGGRGRIGYRARYKNLREALKELKKQHRELIPVQGNGENGPA
jgi:hypothetical protein